MFIENSCIFLLGSDEVLKLYSDKHTSFDNLYDKLQYCSYNNEHVSLLLVTPTTSQWINVKLRWNYNYSFLKLCLLK